MPAKRDSLLDFDKMPDSAQVRRAIVGQLFGIAPSTVSKWADAGVLPKPMRVGKFCFWNVGVLRNCMAQMASVVPPMPYSEPQPRQVRGRFVGRREQK